MAQQNIRIEPFVHISCLYSAWLRRCWAACMFMTTMSALLFTCSLPLAIINKYANMILLCLCWKSEKAGGGKKEWEGVREKECIGKKKSHLSLYLYFYPWGLLGCCHFIPFSRGRGCTGACPSSGRRQGTRWTSRQLITGPLLMAKAATQGASCMSGAILGFSIHPRKKISCVYSFHICDYVYRLFLIYFSMHACASAKHMH